MTPIIPADETLPAETIEKPALDGVFVSHLRYQDQSEDGSKTCTVTAHYMSAETGEKDYTKKAYTLRTGDMDALMSEVPEVGEAFLAFTSKLTLALPAWLAKNAAESSEDVDAG
jgi:hypothetical protein